MAASSYDEALRRLLIHEGGYGDHPDDPGGPTKYGITIGDFRKYVKPDATAQDVKAMSVAQASAIYRAHYWNALACDRLAAGFDYALFDYGVNSGVARAQRVARSLVAKNGANKNGANALDNACIAALNAADAGRLIARLCDERLAFLQRLKTWPIFGKGWGRRVAEVRVTALAMAATAQQPRAPQPQASAVGKGVVPLGHAAQRGSAGAIAAGGALAAGQAQHSGAPVGLVLLILAATALLASGVWMFWRWRQRRRQTAPA